MSTNEPQGPSGLGLGEEPQKQSVDSRIHIPNFKGHRSGAWIEESISPTQGATKACIQASKQWRILPRPCPHMIFIHGPLDCLQ